MLLVNLNALVAPDNVIALAAARFDCDIAGRVYAKRYRAGYIERFYFLILNRRRAVDYVAKITDRNRVPALSEVIVGVFGVSVLKQVAVRVLAIANIIARRVNVVAVIGVVPVINSRYRVRDGLAVRVQNVINFNVRRLCISQFAQRL